MIRRLLFLLLVYAADARAQPATRLVALLHYALDSFTNGKVLMKSGAVSEQKLNYNLLTGEMIFESAGKYLAIANPQEVDTVFIQQRKFVPVEEHFYEWLTGTQPALFKEYTCTVKEPGTETGFGTTNTSATASLNTLIKSGGAYALKLPEDFKVIPHYNYWVRKKTSFYKITNPKQLANLYPAKKGLIDDWGKKKEARFSKQDEVMALIDALQ